MPESIQDAAPASLVVSTIIPLPTAAADRTRIEQVRDDLELTLDWGGIEPHGPEVQARIEETLTAVLRHHDLFDSRVACDAATNTPARRRRGELWVDVAVALRAGDWVRIPCRLIPQALRAAA
jgi:hypothetical protein